VDVNKYTVVDLMLIEKDGNSHYCVIRNINGLLASQFPHSNHGNHFCKRFICRFASEKSLNDHEHYKHKTPKWVVLTADGKNIVKCRNYNHSMEVPFAICADFECSIGQYNDDVEEDTEKSYTIKQNQRKPNGFSYFIKYFDYSLYYSTPVTCSAKSDDEDVGLTFLTMIKDGQKMIYEKFEKNPKPLVMTPADTLKYEMSNTCHIRQGHIHDKSDKVKDHCHLTGMFRGAAHTNCNLKYKVPTFLPVLFHNLSGYDAHLFIKKMGRTKNECRDVSIIGSTEEKYISFSEKIVVDKEEVTLQEWPNSY
jgi:hypothetical protein